MHLEKSNVKTILSVADASLKIGDNQILDHVDLELKEGQLASLIGPNGAGKSTLLQAIAGLIKLDSGRIECHARRVGYVPQQVALERELPLTVREFLSLKKLSRRGDSGISQVLEEIGAAHLESRQLGRLSGGEFQRVMIAYGLLGNPDLLLLDEPLTGVDFRGGMTFHTLLHHLHEDLGLTVLMVSHDMHLIEHMSEVVFCLNRIMCCHGDPDEILSHDNLAQVYGHDHGSGA